MVALQADVSELVLHVNERASFRRRAHTRLGRRAISRRLSVVAARLERSVDYQSSLRRVLAADEEFRRTLDEAQRTSWLALEDALQDHAWRVNRAFFRAGLEMGWRAEISGAASARKPPHGEAHRTSSSRQAHARHARYTAREAEVVRSLLAIIRKLVER